MFAFADLRRAARRSCSLARDRLGKKPLFYAVLDGALHFASEMQGARAEPALERRRSISRRSRTTCRSATSSRRRRSTGTSASWSRDTGCASRRPAWRSGSTGTSSDSTPTPAAEAELVDDIDASLRSAVTRAARERSAARRVPLRRHRLGPGRRPTWRRRSADRLRDDDGRLRRLGAQRARGGGASRPTRFGTDAPRSGARAESSTTCSIRSCGAFDEPFADASAVPTCYLSRIGAARM